MTTAAIVFLAMFTIGLAAAYPIERFRDANRRIDADLEFMRSIPPGVERDQ